MGRPAGLCALLLVLLLVNVIVHTSSLDMADYLIARERLLKYENCARLGSNQQLDPSEKMVSRFMIKEKQNIIFYNRPNGSIYIPSSSFFISRQWMTSTTIFKIIRKMPKGAALHIHELALTSIDWLISNLTYRNNVYMCVAKHGYLKFAVFTTLPTSPDCTWKSVRKERDASGNVVLFNYLLKKNLSLLATDPLKTFVTQQAARDRLHIYEDQVVHLIRRPTVLKDYLRQAVEELREDNIQYIELRARLTGMKDEDGNTLTPEQMMELYDAASKETRSQHTDFAGFRIIQESPRYSTYNEVLAEVQLAMKLRSTYPDLHVGFDFVDYENPGQPLVYYIDALLYPSQQSPAVKLPFFFHTATATWFGTDSEVNIVDAVLLNATRIGNIYSLVRYVKTAKIFKDKQVGVEVTPISNQVMGLVRDLRNHAMIPMFVINAPLIISSDYPGAWEALPLSHDLYVTLTTMSAMNAGLPFLKQLVINSIKFSALNSEERANLHALWSAKWTEFIDQMVSENSLQADSFTEIAENGDGCGDFILAYSTTAYIGSGSCTILSVFFSLCLSLTLR